MNRRSFLGSTITVLVAGCGTSQPSQPAVTVPRLTIENLDNAPHTVQIQLLEGGNTIFAEQAELPPATYKDGEWEQPTYASWNDVASTGGRYTLRVTVDDGKPTDHRLPDRGNDCVRPEVEILPDGSHGMAYFNCP